MSTSNCLNVLSHLVPLQSIGIGFGADDWSSDSVAPEAKRTEQFSVEDVSPIENDVASHQISNPRPVKLQILGPLRREHQSIGTTNTLVRIWNEVGFRDHRFGCIHGLGVCRNYVSAISLKGTYDGKSGGSPQIVSSGLEGEA